MKYSQDAVERGFRFIKDKSFQCNRIYLKTPQRIDALMMVMTLSLLVYNLGQHHLREQLKTLRSGGIARGRHITLASNKSCVFFKYHPFGNKVSWFLKKSAERRLYGVSTIILNYTFNS